ncbi:sensor histidine kinase [Chryseobacterium gregarium]|uniref:sensor histidine kinase n=1 Tax=Chryseobacterium gregarium TaxID=456299 RepID=UPI000427E258|nr:ATP-binding protein [Chryseobacterium gregarium]
MHSKNEQINTLTDLNEELENYFRNTIIPQLFVDGSLILRKFTPPAMKQFRLSEGDLGRPLADVAENFRFPTFIDNIKHVMATGEILEKEIQTTDLRWYQMNILPYITRADKLNNGVIITFIDITSRIEDLWAQEKLVAEHELLLDTIAHDIKTPLTSLGLNVELLKRLPEKGMGRFPQLVDNLEQSLLKMKSVVNELIDSRWQGQKYQPTKELIDLQNIIEDARLTLAPQIREAEAKITYDIQASEILFVRRKLRSIIYNLLNNAIKYRSDERKPDIKIASAEEDGFMAIRVEDNGIGIPSGSEYKIFEKYNRISDQKEGNGIGLYLVKEIIETCGGRIEVKSEEDKGSVFKVYLKLQDQDV